MDFLSNQWISYNINGFQKELQGFPMELLGFSKELSGIVSKSTSELPAQSFPRAAWLDIQNEFPPRSRENLEKMKNENMNQDFNIEVS